MVFDWTAPLLIIGLIILFAKSRYTTLLSDREMLEKRYSSGQIDRETYEHETKALEE